MALLHELKVCGILYWLYCYWLSRCSRPRHTVGAQRLFIPADVCFYLIEEDWCVFPSFFFTFLLRKVFPDCPVRLGRCFIWFGVNRDYWLSSAKINPRPLGDRLLNYTIFIRRADWESDSANSNIQVSQDLHRVEVWEPGPLMAPRSWSSVSERSP